MYYHTDTGGRNKVNRTNENQNSINPSLPVSVLVIYDEKFWFKQKCPLNYTYTPKQIIKTPIF